MTGRQDHRTSQDLGTLFGRPLINRNPAQSSRDYRPGHDGRFWATA